MINTIAAILTAVVIGLAIARHTSPLVRLGLSFLYGVGAIYGVLLVLGLFRWSLLAAVLLLLAIAAAAYWLRRPHAHPEMRPLPADALRSGPLQVALDLATFVTVSAYASVVTAGRAHEWDFWSIWGLKARSFFEAGRIDHELLTRHSFLHGDYPLLVPLNFDFIAMMNGAWDDRWLGLLYVAFAVSLLLIIRGLVEDEIGAVWAAAITFASTPFALNRQVGLADAPLLAFSAAGLLLIRRGSIRDGAVLLGLAAATKNEGLALIVAVAIALAITGSARRIAELWPAAVIVLPWLVLRLVWGLQTDLGSTGALGRLVERVPMLPSIARLLAEHLPRPHIWIVIIIGALIVAKRGQFVLIAIAVWFASFVAAYMVTPHDPQWHVATSWSRLAPQLALPLLVVVMLELARRWSTGEDRPHAEARSDR